MKDFDHFADHVTFVDDDMDPLFGKALFGLKGQKWRDMRATLSPAFTGSKMRQMLGLMIEVGKQSVDSVKSHLEKTGPVFEMRDFLKKFTVDIIATCAFGIEVNSFENPDNEFQKITEKATNFATLKNMLVMAGYQLVPKLMKALNLSIMDKDMCQFFQTTILNVMKEREAKGIVRHDMINLLMEAQKGKLSYSAEEKTTEGFATVEESDIGKSQVTRKWEDEEIAAQAFIFFLAGFDTVSTTMSLIAYELAVNPDVQEKLIKELDETKRLLDGGDITYDHLQKMKYMDQVISETLR